MQALGVDPGAAATKAALWRDGRATAVDLGIAGRARAAERVTGTTLWSVVSAAERDHGPFQSVVVCHPATWSADRVNPLARAARGAGLDPPGGLHLVPGVVAACEALARAGSVYPGSRLVVCDLGASRVEVASVSVDNDGCHLDGPARRLAQSGELVDAAILGRVLGRVHHGDVVASGSDDAEAQAAEERLRQEVREAREALFDVPRVVVTVPTSDGPATVPVTREDVDDLLEPLARELSEAVRDRLDALSSPRDATVVLLGGLAGTSALVAALARTIDVPVSVAPDPGHIAVLGAAALGARLTGLAAPVPVDPGQVPTSTLAVPATPSGHSSPDEVLAVEERTPIGHRPRLDVAMPASRTSSRPAVDQQPAGEAAAGSVAEGVTAVPGGPHAAGRDADTGELPAVRGSEAQPSGSRRRTVVAGGVIGVALVASLGIAAAFSVDGGDSAAAGQPCEAAAGSPPWVCVTSAAVVSRQLVVELVAEAGSSVPVDVELFGADTSQGEQPPVPERGDAVERVAVDGSSVVRLDLDEAAAFAGWTAVCARVSGVETPSGNCREIVDGPVVDPSVSTTTRSSSTGSSTTGSEATSGTAGATRSLPASPPVAVNEPTPSPTDAPQDPPPAPLPPTPSEAEPRPAPSTSEPPPTPPDTPTTTTTTTVTTTTTEVPSSEASAP